MMKSGIAAAAFKTIVLLASPATAATALFDFAGSGISGSFQITYVSNPNTGTLGTSPNTVDPVGSYIVSGISGVFSNANIGIANATITGIVASDPSSPSPTNLLAPRSFGHYPIASGVPTPEGIAPGLSYDNLFYPGGSSQTATDYLFSGGFFDIYGIVFTITDGNAARLRRRHIGHRRSRIGDMGDDARRLRHDRRICTVSTAAHISCDAHLR